MRTIKYRGKRLDNGEWIYGDLVHLLDDKVGIVFNPSDIGYIPVSKVDPNTVGEHVGICDSNGVEIYEGDFLLYPDQRSGEVHLKKNLCGFYTEDFRTIEKEMTIVGNAYDGLVPADSQQKKGGKR